jgi:hypothetical protein
MHVSTIRKVLKKAYAGTKIDRAHFMITFCIDHMLERAQACLKLKHVRFSAFT